LADTEPALPTQAFGLERHLQEFLRDNWDSTLLGNEWRIYEEDGDADGGVEYVCEAGRIGILARYPTRPEWLVVELKRNQTGDTTLGQAQRYMGWAKEALAESGEMVRGLVIARSSDSNLRYALSMAKDVDLKLYEVDFRLLDTDL
jgi:restriction system protein